MSDPGDRLEEEKEAEEEGVDTADEVGGFRVHEPTKDELDDDDGYVPESAENS
jgi:hypothetical protein